MLRYVARLHYNWLLFLTSTRTASSKMRIEVEKKFRIPENINETLKKLDAVELKSESFTDRYHDTADLRLTHNDNWLRLRDQIWELKSPHRNFSRLESSTCKYEEFVGEEEIVGRLEKVFKGEKFELGKMIEFAKFSTERRTYKLPQALIVLDRTDFGHAVGEMEIVVDSEDKVADAENKLAELSQILGCHGDQWTPGKMETFLMTRRPEHYQSLIEARVLRGK